MYLLPKIQKTLTGGWLASKKNKRKGFVNGCHETDYTV